MLKDYANSDQVLSLESKEKHEIEKKDYNNASVFL